MKKFYIGAFVLASFMAGGPAAAQTDVVDLCGLPENAESLEQVFDNVLGAWQIEHLSGYVVSAAGILPFGASPDGPETITLVREGNDMYMTHPMAPVPVKFMRPTQGEWRFIADDNNKNIPAPALSSEDLAIVTDCNNADLPRLIGQASITMNGVAMDFTYRLILTSLQDTWDTGYYTGTMYGVLHLNAVARGMPMTMRRTIRLFR